MTRRGEITFRVVLASLMAIYFAGMHGWITQCGNPWLSLGIGVFTGCFLLAILPKVPIDSLPQKRD
jgi:hypothetical protein